MIITADTIKRAAFASLTEMAARELLVQTARAYVGTRYRHQGRTREHGVDCLGLLAAVARDLSLSYTMLDGDETYSMRVDGDYFVARLRAEMIELATWREARPGDAVMSTRKIGEAATHIGIVSSNEPDNLRCIHSSRSERGVCENRWQDQSLVMHGFRLKELAAIIEKGGRA